MISPWLVSTHTAYDSRAERAHLLAPALPAFGPVLDFKIAHALTTAIYDHHIVMIRAPSRSRLNE